MLLVFTVSHWWYTDFHANSVFRQWLWGPWLLSFLTPQQRSVCVTSAAWLTVGFTVFISQSLLVRSRALQAATNPPEITSTWWLIFCYLYLNYVRSPKIYIRALQFVFDIVLISLTLTCAIRSWRSSPSRLYSVLLKHNIFYYACGLCKWECIEGWSRSLILIDVQVFSMVNILTTRFLHVRHPFAETPLEAKFLLRMHIWACSSSGSLDNFYMEWNLTALSYT